MHVTENVAAAVAAALLQTAPRAGSGQGGVGDPNGIPSYVSLRADVYNPAKLTAVLSSGFYMTLYRRPVKQTVLIKMITCTCIG